MSPRTSLPGAITFDAFLRDERASGATFAGVELLAELTERVPIAHGWVVRTEAGSANGLWDVVEHAQEEGEAVRVSVLGADGTASSVTRDDGPDKLAEWRAAQPSGGHAILAVPIDSFVVGRATSTNANASDADEVCVWVEGGSACWKVDRRSIRVSESGDGLDVVTAESVADLADRVQLALGRPVEIDWVLQAGRPVLVACRDLVMPFRIVGPAGGGSWRRVSLALDDEGTVVPLAVDTLDLALRRPGDPAGVRVVERVFARPYRRRADVARQGSAEPKSLGRAGAHAARAAAEVTAFLNEVLRFERSYRARISALTQDHRRMSSHDLAVHLSDWQALAGEPLALLNRGRRHNREAIAALESVVGTVSRDLAVALSMPRFTSRRRRVHSQLGRLSEFTKGRAPSDLEAGARVAWKEARADLSDVRALGIDLNPVAFGASNASLAKAVASRLDERSDAREARRKDAAAQVVAATRTHLLALPRAALARTLVELIKRLARAKGALAEALAQGLLGLRGVALEAGRRLEEEAVLDDPEDALYLSSKEIRKALGGNVAGYAARVRARREDDARWRNFPAPRRLGA